jgi:hypothetical protein
MTDPMIQVLVRMPSEMVEQLKRRASEHDRSLAAEVRRAVRWYCVDQLVTLHYYSTYCIHGQHADCRLTCKVCASPCRCKCHTEAEDSDG